VTVLDSSVIIDYLDGVDDVVEFVDEQPVLRTSSICVYEVLAGELFSSGEPDLVGTRAGFGRVRAIDFSEDLALEAAGLQTRLLEDGAPMSPRDLLVAATARSVGDELAVSDADFDTDELREVVAVTRL
jgi:predicted nucleic acid-binding protein